MREKDYYVVRDIKAYCSHVTDFWGDNWVTHSCRTCCVFSDLNPDEK